jgi:hypothetical protein
MIIVGKRFWIDCGVPQNVVYYCQAAKFAGPIPNSCQAGRGRAKIRVAKPVGPL